MKNLKQHFRYVFTVFLFLPTLAAASMPDEGNATVELSRFSAEWVDNIIALKWNTTIERNNLGFEIERRCQFEDRWTTVGFVRGSGRNRGGREYSFTEYLVPDKMIMYRIRQVTDDGRSLVSRPLTLLPDGLPNSFRISTNEADPFRRWANADFVLSKEGHVSLKVYDIHGKQVHCIADNVALPSGHHIMPFPAKDLASGTYSVRLITPDGIRSSVVISI